MMDLMNFALFETALGCCGIVWSERGIRGRDAQTPAAALSRGARRRASCRGAPRHRRYCCPARRRAQGLKSGEDRPRCGVGVPSTRLRGRASHSRRRALSYGEVAEPLGDRNLARDVAEALSQNPCPIIVPCHRVLAADGKPGGFSAPGGVATKLRLLTIEGAQPQGRMEAPLLFDRLPLAAARPRR
jgi:methylated-DNA-[protein]-cysteine S-methyltransferase